MIKLPFPTKNTFPTFHLACVKLHFHFLFGVLLAAGMIINRLLSQNLGSLFDVSDTSVSNEEICSSDQGMLIFKQLRGGLFLDIVHLWPLPPSSAKWIGDQISPFAFKLHIPLARDHTMTERNPCVTESLIAYNNK